MKKNKMLYRIVAAVLACAVVALALVTYQSLSLIHIFAVGKRLHHQRRVGLVRGDYQHGVKLFCVVVQRLGAGAVSYTHLDGYKRQVNGDHSPIPEQQLHAAGIHVEFDSER